MAIKNIIFDFDGVICESVNIKTEAFYEMYLPYGEKIAKKVRVHHLQNGGMSRFEKFRYYETVFLNKPVSEERIQELAVHFSALVMRKVIDAPFVKGALEFLEQYANKYRCFIVSATPIEEMKKIAEEKKIDHYFTEIFGSPTNKTEWGKHILETYGLQAEETLFIGDAIADYIAAKENGIHFLWRQTDHLKEIPDITPQIEDLSSLQAVLQANTL